MYEWGKNFIEYKKIVSKKLETIYNVKYKYKTDESKSNKEKKIIFNEKLLNIIIKLENQELGLNKY